jgi:phage gpG-like protein
MISIRIDASGVLSAVDQIERSWTTRNLEAVADALREGVAQQFAEGGIPRWAGLARRTIDMKRLSGYPRLNRFGSPSESLFQRGSFGPGNILIRTGALLSSWTRKDDPNHIQRIDGQAVEIGSSMPYAGFHQKGTPRLPQREIVVTREMEQEAARRLIQEEA